MSRAFVKENDHETEEYPERVIPEERNLVTKRGFDLIEAEVRKLQAELQQAKADQDQNLTARLLRDLRYWTERQKSAEIVPPPKDSAQVYFGSQVTLEDEDGHRKIFRIVGLDEADPKEGRLSYTSPVALALMGKEVGDVILIGSREAEIIAIGF